MVIHAECTVYAFLPLLMAMAISPPLATQEVLPVTLRLQLFFLASLHRIVGRRAEPAGNDATAVSRTGEADSSSMICWFADARVCGSQVSILSAQSPQTAWSSSLECAIHGAVWAPPLGHGCA